MTIFKRLIVSSLAGLMLLSWAHTSCALTQDEINAQTALHEEATLKARDSYTCLMDVPGRGASIYYAQNSPEWADLAFGSKDYGQIRPFGGAGCVCTSLAIAVANLVPSNALPRMQELMRKQFQIDTRSMSVDAGLGYPRRFCVRTPDDFLRFFPLSIGQYAVSNNRNGVKNPNSHSFYKFILNHFKLPYVHTKDRSIALRALDMGGIVVTSSGGQSSPFSVGGHYFTLMSHKDGYVYFFDPFRDFDYPNDSKNVIEVVRPGLCRFSADRWEDVKLNSMFVILPEGGDLDTLQDFNKPLVYYAMYPSLPPRLFSVTQALKTNHSLMRY